MLLALVEPGAEVSDPRRFWVGFNLVKGIGAVRMQALLDHFDQAETAWYAPADELRSAGLGQTALEHLLQVRQDVNLDDLWERISAQGIRVLTWMDEDYPLALKHLDRSPPVLYLRGTLLPEDAWAIAIVGTRRMTAYGRQVAGEIATFLVHKGITVVSGLARGIDGEAHRAALEANGRTLAVLGSGVDRIYPPEHRQLAAEITQQGALISDYPPGTPPESINFPPRNRIISGLSLAVVVVEAGKSSGALITASFAAEQGREVFAVPGNIYAPQSRGTNLLIQKGARPLLRPEEILEVLDLTQHDEQRVARQALPVDENEAQLLRLLKSEPRHVDDLSAETGWGVEQVSSTLALMELKGLVRPMGGMKYMAVHEPQADYQGHVDD